MKRQPGDWLPLFLGSHSHLCSLFQSNTLSVCGGWRTTVETKTHSTDKLKCRLSCWMIKTSLIKQYLHWKWIISNGIPFQTHFTHPRLSKESEQWVLTSVIKKNSPNNRMLWTWRALCKGLPIIFSFSSHQILMDEVLLWFLINVPGLEGLHNCPRPRDKQGVVKLPTRAVSQRSLILLKVLSSFHSSSHQACAGRPRNAQQHAGTPAASLERQLEFFLLCSLHSLSLLSMLYTGLLQRVGGTWN